jgi:hypothetical protein
MKTLKKWKIFSPDSKRLKKQKNKKGDLEMLQNQFFNQMLQLNKTIFDNSFNAMETLRKQNEKTANSLLDQAVWLPEDGKKAINEWMQAHKKGCDNFKKAVDQNYKNIENFWAVSGK